MEDPIPRTLEGQVLSIADKLDTLRECFRIGMIPTGSKDPFALRRAAQGIVKILFEAKLAAAIDGTGWRTIRSWRSSCVNVFSSTCARCSNMPTTK